MAEDKPKEVKIKVRVKVDRYPEALKLLKKKGWTSIKSLKTRLRIRESEALAIYEKLVKEKKVKDWNIKSKEGIQRKKDGVRLEA